MRKSSIQHVRIFSQKHNNQLETMAIAQFIRLRETNFQYEHNITHTIANRIVYHKMLNCSLVFIIASMYALQFGRALIPARCIPAVTIVCEWQWSASTALIPHTLSNRIQLFRMRRMISTMNGIAYLTQIILCTCGVADLKQDALRSFLCNSRSAYKISVVCWWLYCLPPICLPVEWFGRNIHAYRKSCHGIKH